MAKVAGLIFVGAIFVGLLIGMFVVCFFIAIQIINVIRIWWPTCAEYERPEDAKTVDPRGTVRRVALDFLLDAKRAREKALRQQLRDLQASINIPIQQTEWGIGDIARLVQIKSSREQTAHSE